MDQTYNIQDDIDHILVTGEEIRQAVEKIGKQINQDYQGKQPVFICILKGASIFFADLVRQIQLPLSIDFMAISSYGKSTKTSGIVRILKDLDHDIQGKDVIVVEDIVDSGLTLTYIKKVLNQRGANSIRVATLLDKPERRQTELTVDYHGFVIPNEFVVGYGLDYNEMYRNYPEIGVLKPRVYDHEE